MKEIELKNLRSKKEKHFLRENGEILAQVYNNNIHYLKDNKYVEIDNTLVKENNYYTNKDNDYHVYFDTDNDYLLRINKDDDYINIKLDKNNISNIIKDKENIYYYNILKNIDIKYNIISNKVKEDIILKDKEFENINYIIETNLELTHKNKKIYLNKDNKQIFIMNTPFMYDSNNIINNNINYELTKLGNNLYALNLVLDTDWLNDSNRLYPVIIDPTITEYDDENSCYDTYIYSGDTNVDRNNTDILKAGVERVNDVDIINRTLIKFQLPKIGTGSQVINSELRLYGYPAIGEKYDSDIISIHQITQDWNEETANWNTMHDKYNSRIEGSFDSVRSFYYAYTEDPLTVRICGDEITGLVKKWYADTPNYGIMLKMNTEEYNTDVVPAFFSKNNTVTGYNPKPILSVIYRNQNGLENYMDYKTQNFNRGNAYLNMYNGNLTTMFNIGSTISGKLPATLNMFYNTNDVVLENNIGYGLGYKLNYNQTIKEETIDSTKYLNYVDEDGTIHYFYNKDEVYKDEDGLNITITPSETEYILTDKNGNKMIFTIDSTTDEKLGYLTEIIDLDNNKIQIEYDVNHKIIKVVDANNQEINITYEENKTSIVSPDQTVYLNYVDENLTSIEAITGTTTFTYNTNKVINKIIDETGLGIAYEYYDQIPYRVKKISELGLNEEIGTYFNITYNFNSTTLTDNKNRVSTNTFNNYGNIASITSLESGGNINEAYGQLKSYGKSFTSSEGTNYTYKNKLMSVDNPFKYVKNYLTNTCFEEETINFNNTSGLNLEISEEYSELGNKSLKATNTSSNKETFEYNIEVPKNEYYTFSTYIKNDSNIKLSMYYLDVNNEKISSNVEEININDEFTRYDVSIHYSSEATSNLFISFEMNSLGTTYIDCIQLEKGEAVNNYNLLENSDFSSGDIDWTLHVTDRDNDNTEIDSTGFFEIVTLENNIKALKVNMNPRYSTNFQKTFNTKGKAGETYNISFWYKHKGQLGGDGVGALHYNNVIMNFAYANAENTGHGLSPSDPFNPNENEWQYFQTSFVAEQDFSSFFISFFQSRNANEFYITNMSLFRSPGKTSYNYDEFGNIIESSNTSGELSSFNYDKNNQLIKSTNPLGQNFTYEYDSNVTDRLLKAISGTGISNEIKYDEIGNPITTKITNYGKSEILENGYYKIRSKGTSNYIKNYKLGLVLENSNCNHNLWYIESETITIDTTDEQEDVLGETITKTIYKIKHPILNKYICIQNNTLVLSNNHTDFELLQNNDGSFFIKEYNLGSAIKANNQTLSVESLVSDDYNFEFYFENTNQLFIESNSEYTEDGRYITSITDTLLNKTTYDIDTTTGLTNSITNPKNQTTYYEYDEKRRLKKVTNEDKTIEYTYNTNNLLSKIKESNREYNFVYDNHLNTKQIKIGDNISLITHNYEENNGNLLSSTYGNNHTISFTYDEFDRIKQTIKMDDTYKNIYDSNGNLAKTTSNNDTYKYTYDLAKLLREYRFNNFKVKYNYDKNNNISNKKYVLNTLNQNINYTYNDDNSIIKTELDNNEINYTYDYLGRITNRNINNSYNTDYTYITNGKRTSLLIKTLKNNNDIYKYKYDKLNNITHIYLNDNLINKYYYDNYNELIREHDYQNNQTIEYTYDNYGNLLSKKTYELNTTTLVSENTYEYSNTNWVDQLTKFNNDSITYDEIGNPLTIGSKKLTWINGRQLNSYNDGTNNITYKYDKDGIRKSKTINNVTTNYYVEGNDIVFEETNNNVIYYIRDISGLTGFKYNDNIYYYIKNLQNDIIGILDSNYQEIVKYKYDSWGNILSILDNNGNDISNNPTHIANINSYRYRSYYYDKETDLYYLNSRYYNPKWGRFLNADSFISTGQGIIGNNMFSYCANNSINRKDTEGKGWITALIITAVAVTITAITTKALINNKIDKTSANDIEKKLAKKDPLAAWKGNEAKDIANEYQKKLYPNTYIFDANQANAFKHAMWNAVMTDKIGVEKAKKFADAHEEPFLISTPMLCRMDLHNNELGRQIALKYAGQSYDVFAQKIQEAINKGDAYVITWDEGN